MYVYIFKDMNMDIGVPVNQLTKDFAFFMSTLVPMVFLRSFTRQPDCNEGPSPAADAAPVDRSGLSLFQSTEFREDPTCRGVRGEEKTHHFKLTVQSNAKAMPLLESAT